MADRGGLGTDGEDDEDPDFVIELLNGSRRKQRVASMAGNREDLVQVGADGRVTDSFLRAIEVASNASASVEDNAPEWDDGGSYALAAEAAGVNVAGMLEAGTDPQKLLQFVSTYRRREGDKLGAMDEEKIDLATERLLQRGRQEGCELTNNKAKGHNSHQGPHADTQAPKMDSGHPRPSRRRPHFSPQSGIENHSKSPPRGGGRDRRHSRSHSGAAAGASASASRQDDGLDTIEDGEETARLCKELLRWSSALDGVVGDAGDEAGEGLGKDNGRGRRGGRWNRGMSSKQGEEGSRRDPSLVTGDPTSTQDRLGLDKWLLGASDHSSPVLQVPPQEGSLAAGRPGRTTPDSRDYQEQARLQGLKGGSGTRASLDWRGVDLLPGPPPSKGGGVRTRRDSGNGNLGSVPSYAQPTKHFKMINRECPRHIDREGTQRQNRIQRQLEEENQGLRLRMEGQRRAIHELEHQAQTLREEVRLRNEEVVKLKRKVMVATTSASGAGTCSCCASTHTRGAVALRGGGGGVDEVVGIAALKREIVAATSECRELEKLLLESRAKEQRTREISATLKQSSRGAQERADRAESELQAVKRALAAAKRGAAEQRRDAKACIKDSRKCRRQHEELLQEKEAAREECAELKMLLRKASFEAERKSAEAVALREKVAEVEAQAGDLARENRILEDRLREGQLKGKIRERNRNKWIMSELQSKLPPSPHPPESSLRQNSVQGQQKSAHFSPTGVNKHRGIGLIPPRRAAEMLRDLKHSAESEGSDSYSPDRGCLSSSSPQNGRFTGRGSSSRAGEQHQQQHFGGGGARGNRGRPNSSHGLSLGAERDEVSSQVSARIRGPRQAIEDGCPGSSMLSAGSDRSTMGARYDRLQAMYRRVNRKDDRR